MGKDSIKTIWYSEIDKHAIKTYNKNFPDTPFLWDVTKIDIDKIPNFDLLVGWFPCQDCSLAGKQDLSKWRTILVKYMLEILEVKQPDYFIFENVKNILSKKFMPFFESILKKSRKGLIWYCLRCI